MIAVECSITPAILLTGRGAFNPRPACVMSIFLIPFALLEFVRAWVAFWDAQCFRFNLPITGLRQRCRLHRQRFDVAIGCYLDDEFPA